jgi:hypothetical protein
MNPVFTFFQLMLTLLPHLRLVIPFGFSVVAQSVKWLGCRLDDSGSILDRSKTFFLLAPAFKPAPGAHAASCPMSLYEEVKRTEHQVDPVTEVKNDWRCTSNGPYVCLVKYRDVFTLLLLCCCKCEENFASIETVKTIKTEKPSILWRKSAIIICAGNWKLVRAMCRKTAVTRSLCLRLWINCFLSKRSKRSAERQTVTSHASSLWDARRWSQLVLLFLFPSSWTVIYFQNIYQRACVHVYMYVSAGAPARILSYVLFTKHEHIILISRCRQV